MIISINLVIALLLLPQIFADQIHKDDVYLSDDELAAYHSRLAAYRIRQAAIVYHTSEDDQIDFDLLKSLERDDQILEAAISFHREDKGLDLEQDPRVVLEDNPSNHQDEETLLTESLPMLLLHDAAVINASAAVEEDSASLVWADLHEEGPAIAATIDHSQVQPSMVVGNRSNSDNGFDQDHMDDGVDDLSLRSAGFTTLDAMEKGSARLLWADLQRDDPSVEAATWMVVGNNSIPPSSYPESDHGHFIHDSIDELSLRPLGFTNHLRKDVFINDDLLGNVGDGTGRDLFDDPAASTTSDIANYLGVQRFDVMLDPLGSVDNGLIAQSIFHYSLVTNKDHTGITSELRNCFNIAGSHADDSAVHSMLAQPCDFLRNKGVGCRLVNKESPNNADRLVISSGLPCQKIFDISALEQQTDLTAVHCIESATDLQSEGGDDMMIIHYYNCASGEGYARIVPIIKQHADPAPPPTDTPPPLVILLFAEKRQFILTPVATTSTKLS